MFSSIITFGSINSSGTIPSSRHALGYRLDDMQRQRGEAQQPADEAAVDAVDSASSPAERYLSSSSNPFHPMRPARGSGIGIDRVAARIAASWAQDVGDGTTIEA